MSQRPLIEVEEVSKTYTVKAFAYHYTVEALRQVSFSVKEGEVLGIVGESGSGKSTLAKILVRIVSPDAGSVVYADTITQFQRQVQMIFQNPYTSLNPLMNVRSALAEVIAVHRLCARREMPDRIQKALAQVELPPDIQDRKSVV